jgi:hypothetical protein
MDEIAQASSHWSIEDRRRVIRELLVHEDKLTADRIQALYTLQGFLFASFGLFAGKQFDPPILSQLIVSVFSLTGCMSALVYGQELRFNTNAITGLLNKWNSIATSCGDPDPLPIIGFEATKIPGGPRWLSRRTVPILFVVVWLCILTITWLVGFNIPQK